MKTWKRALALVLALVMALSLVALPSFAEGEETGGGTESGPKWDDPGSILLNKVAQPVENKEGIYEITLTIQGKNFETNSDVVLVIDKSGSMNDDDKLLDTKKAAIAFGEKLLTKGSTTRIAIVTYAETAASINNGHFYTADELDAFKSQINGIKASGGTNQQAGIHVAQQLLDSDSPVGNLKNIVILSDGVPTYSYAITGSITCTRDAYVERDSKHVGYVYATMDVDWSTANIVCNHNNRIGSGYGIGVKKQSGLSVNSCGEYSSYISHGIATIWEAKQAKATGTTIFSVALQVDTEGENILKACATDPTKGYYAIGKNDNVETKLKDAFTAIAGSIAIAAKNGKVTDPMSDYVSLDFTGNPVVTSDEAVYKNGQADVYLSQGTVTRNEQTLSWDVGNINEDSPAIMKYRVHLNDNVESGNTYPTNKTTTFNYTDYQGNPAEKEFPIPTVNPEGGTILVHYYLVDADGKPINADGKVMDSPEKAQVLAQPENFQYNGTDALDYNSSYDVSKKNIEGATYYGYTLNGRDAANPDVQGREDTVSVEITSTNANREVWFAYYQTFNVAHVRMDENGAAKTVNTDTYPVSAEFNLTDKVTSNYLYGGAFNNAACTEPYPFTNEGETGLSFAPQAGATYYIWEVPNTYLIPKVLYGNGHYEDTGYQMDVVGLYMVSAIDCINYAEVGFYLDDKRTKADQTTYTDIVDNREETKIATVSGSVAFSNVSITKKDTTTDVYTASSLVPADKYGYMLCYGVSKESKWQTAGESFTYYPYWVTLDGVEVTNGTTRTVTYNGPGNSQPSVSDSYDRAAECKTPAANASAQLLLMDSYCADGTPIAADTPAVENVTVTVVDAAKTYELTVSAGTGIRDQVAYQAPAGKVFAGWFADQAYTTPADLDQVTEDTTIYAKYVSDSYLDLAYSRTGLFRLRGVTLISAVDNPANYQASGFVVGDQKVDVSYASRYRIFKTPANLFGAARDAKLMLADKSLSGTGTLEVTPYWITLDGTEVHGVTHTLHYNTRTIWE